MSMPYPEHDVYRHLYARYFQGNRTEQMVALAGDLRGKNVVDLCGGGGRLSELALAGGARVTLVDESAGMAAAVSPGITRVFRDVQTWLASFCGAAEYDVMFCQQAVNYWLTQDVVDDLADAIKPGGVFIFNTFNRKPSRAPTLKQYELEGAKFVEASWLSGEDTVEHVQMREGEAPHTTRFRWISPEQYAEMMGLRFSMLETRDGASSIWHCTRRP